MKFPQVSTATAAAIFASMAETAMAGGAGNETELNKPDDDTRLRDVGYFAITLLTICPVLFYFCCIRDLIIESRQNANPGLGPIIDTAIAEVVQTPGEGAPNTLAPPQEEEGVPSAPAFNSLPVIGVPVTPVTASLGFPTDEQEITV